MQHWVDLITPRNVDYIELKKGHIAQTPPKGFC